MKKKLKICDASLHPGEVANLALPLPEQYSCAPLYMPIKAIHGKSEGPVLLLFSGLTGSELNGLEITNRIISLLDPQKMAGAVIAIPIVNVYGLTHYPASLPTGSQLINCFPGDEKGSFGERMASLLTQEIFKKSDYCIELQTGKLNHNILPQIYCNFEDKKAKGLAASFKTPVVTNVSFEKNSLRKMTEELQVPLLVYQAGEAMRFDQNAINLGVEGVFNVMRSLDMLPEDPITEVNPIFSRDEEWITAHKGGILHTSVSLGQTIKQKEILGRIMDPFGPENSLPVISSQEGVVVGINTAPLIHEGLPIFKVASFLDYDKAGSVIEEWDKQQPDSFIGS